MVYTISIVINQGGIEMKVRFNSLREIKAIKEMMGTPESYLEQDALEVLEEAEKHPQLKAATDTDSLELIRFLRARAKEDGLL